MITLAEKKHLEQIKQLTESCAVAMQQRGIYQWNEHYPSRERLSEDIEKQELYIKVENCQIEGIIVLTNFMDEEYLPVKWLTNSGNNLYIHRLATNPAKWGFGTGKALMDFAENHARQHNFESVRLDTFSKNKRNQKFYESRGYKKLGNIYFPKQSEAPFYCYELLL
ncbi:GNAT family N-acetyltransferase [Autumnicola edwardsiae]|uniref:GNAT family N-acetyltransferase n=1 Tax=Autumnicola edwardsiae TaxID=3075594 RepID=A0ABU3CQQ6_9FLAO|nr:GNAT family N-acetyltransferase [Zunongwangia sp. F297]MDT0648683.1 GNAT family N-acetyltransferase [Zunongwangia sp. F297]